MSYTSIRNKELIELPDGKLLLFADCSDSNVTDLDGKRCWDTGMWHPKGTMYFTKESLKEKQTKYVEEQLQQLRDFNKLAVERGWATEYEEPTLDSQDYCGTRWPNGNKVRHGREFFSGKAVKLEDYLKQYNPIRRIIFDVCDKDYKTVYKDDCLITDDLDEKYHEAMKHGRVYIDVRRY